MGIVLLLVGILIMCFGVGYGFQSHNGRLRLVGGLGILLLGTAIFVWGFQLVL